MRWILLSMVLLAGCNSHGERFRIIKPVTTLAKHGSDIVELTLPAGCEIMVIAEENKCKDSKKLVQGVEGLDGNTLKDNMRSKD